MKNNHRDLMWCLAAMLFVAAVVTAFYWSHLTAGEPIIYSGDALWVLSHIQAVGEGDFWPFLPKVVHRMNAPDAAWWSDFPITDFVYVFPGLLALAVGVVTASTLTVIALHAMAAGAFYVAARWLGAASLPAAALGVIFGLAPYGFVRQLEHLTLMGYWPLPLYVAAAVRCWQWRASAAASRGEVAAVLGIAFVGGLLNPYYLAFFFLLMGFVGVGKLASRDWRHAGLVLLAGAVGMLGFVLQNLDTFIQRWLEGPNPMAMTRDLWWMVKFGLTLPDMFLPSYHASRIVENIGGLGYHWKVPQQLWGESQLAYIGMVAGACLVALVGGGFLRMAQGERRAPGILFWFAMLTFLFAVTGGLNYLVGGLGFPILRASNRYSLALACIALLAAARWIGELKNPRWQGGLCIAAVAIGLWDQIPHFSEYIRSERAKSLVDFRADRIFFPALEAALPPSARVFQLPVTDYPEQGRVVDMGDYEHFRPYLHTKRLHWSHGTVRGRTHVAWQKALDWQRPEDALAQLRQRDFRAILINKRGYADRATDLIASLTALGCRPMMENETFTLLLTP